MLFAASTEKLKNLKSHTSKKKKKIVPSIFCSKYKNEEQKIFREEESIEILKILDLINNIEKYQKI